MAKMRDKLIHHYFGVDYQIVWQVADEEIPMLKKKSKRSLKIMQCLNDKNHARRFPK